MGTKLHQKMVQVLWQYQRGREVMVGYYRTQHAQIRAMLDVVERDYFDACVEVMNRVPLVWSIQYHDLYVQPMSFLCNLYVCDLPVQPYERQEDIVQNEILDILDEYCGFPPCIGDKIWEYTCGYRVVKFNALETWYFGWNVMEFEKKRTSNILLYDATFKNTPKFVVTGCGFHLSQALYKFS